MSELTIPAGISSGKTEKILLDEEWHFQLDPENQGKDQNWGNKLPSPINIKNDHPWEYWFPGYDGVAWYEKEISITKKLKGNLNSIFFEAVAYYCEVWLNGTYLGSHEGAFTPFELLLPDDLLWDQPNRLSVRVINPPINHEIEGFRSGAPLNQSNLPIGKMAWYHNFGGIWQSVRLHSRPKLCLDALEILPQFNSNQLLIRLGLINQSGQPAVKEITARCRILDPNNQQVAAFERLVPCSEKKSCTEWQQPLNDFELEPWSLENPILYRMVVSIESESSAPHEIEERFGFREFNITDNRFTLNNEPVVLKGFLQQGVYPKTLALPDRKMARREMQLLKDNGFNFMRIHLKPAPSWYISLADEIGILIMHEPPIGWIAYSEETTSRCLREVRELITRDINHPSIISWCLLNESFHLLGYTPNQIFKLSDSLLKEAARRDPSRLIINASGGDARAVAGGPDTMIHDTSVQRQCALAFYPWDTTPHPIADDHVYCRYPAGQEVEQKYQNLKAEGLPLFISEFGAPETPPQFEDVLAQYSQQEKKRGLEDVCLHQDFLDTLRSGFVQSELKLTLKEFIHQISQVRASELRSIVHAIRSNPDIAGYCFCQLADASGELFGATDIWRNPKPTFHAYADAVQNPCIGLSLDKRIFSKGGTPTLTCTLNRDDAVAVSGTCDLEVTDQAGKSIWLANRTVTSSELSTAVFDEALSLNLNPGKYSIKAIYQDESNAHSEHQLDFQILNELPEIGQVAIRSSSRELESFLAERSPHLETFGNNFRHKEMPVILDIDPLPTNRGLYGELYGQLHKVVSLGGCAILFNAEVHALYRFLFPHHIRPQSAMRTCGYNVDHPVFEDLPAGGVIAQEFEDVYTGKLDHSRDILEAGGEILAGAFSMNMWTRPAEYYWGAHIYRIPIGRGNVIVCHYDLPQNVATSPVAARMMVNLIRYADSLIQPGGEEQLLSRCMDPIIPIK